MPTDNPKISLYVPQAIYDRFKKFQEERDLSMSQAGIVILAEYFGLEQTIEKTTKGTTIGGVTFDWVKNLENQITELRKEVEQLKNTSKSPHQKENEESEPVAVERELSQPMPIKISHEKLWKTAELAERLGVDKSTVSRKKYKEDFTEWTKDKDPENIGWVTDESGSLSPEKPVSENATVKQIITEQTSEAASPSSVSVFLPTEFDSEKSKNTKNISHSSLKENQSSQLNLLSELPQEVKPLGETLLAKRLGVARTTVSSIKARQSSEKFYEWSKQKDFEGIGWLPNPNGRGYIPGDELKGESLSKLQKWIEKNDKSMQQSQNLEQPEITFS